MASTMSLSVLPIVESTAATVFHGQARGSALPPGMACVGFMLSAATTVVQQLLWPTSSQI